MGKKIKYFMMCLLVGIISLFFVEDVKAEKVFSEELTKLFGFGEMQCFVCGEATEDGVVRLKPNVTSLDEGEMLEIQVFYNSSYADSGPLCQMGVEMLYDTEVLEYMGYSFPNEHILKYGMTLAEYKEEAYPEEFVDSTYNINLITFGYDFLNKPYNEDACVVTFRYKIKKKTDTVRIDCMPSVVRRGKDGVPEAKYFYGDGTDTVDILTLNITDASTTPSALTLSTTPTQGSKEVTVPINIEKNDGFNLLGLTLDYDTSLFTYDSLEIDDSLKSKISLDSIYEAPDSGRIKASFIALEDITNVGDFLKLKLKVKDGVSAGTTSNVGVEVTQVGNKAETGMSGTGTSCAVSITGDGSGEEQQPVLGDVNADKKIDLVDAVYILQNYNQVREFTKVQETAADVDKNGAVNLLDALMIMKRFNGEITAF